MERDAYGTGLVVDGETADGRRAHRGAQRDGRVGMLDDRRLAGRADLAVGAGRGVRAEFLRHHLPDQRHMGRAARQDDVVDVGECDAGPLPGAPQGLVAVGEGPLDQRAGDVVQFGPLQERIDDDRPLLLVGEAPGVAEHVVGLVRERLLRALREDLQLAEAEPVLGVVLGVEVEGVAVRLEHLLEVPGEGLVDVVAAQAVVAADAEHLEGAFRAAQDADVEGAAAEVVHEEGAVTGGGAPAVVAGGGGRLVEQAEDFEPGLLGGLAGRVDLRLVEVGRHGHHGPVDDPADVRAVERRHVRLDPALHLGQDRGRDLRRGVLLAGQVDGRPAAHQAFHRGDRLRGAALAGERLAAHDQFTAGRAAPDAAGRRVRLRDRIAVDHDVAVGGVHHGYGAVGRAEVDAYGLADDLLAHVG